MTTADNRAARRAQLSPERQALLAQLKRGALAGRAGGQTIGRRPPHGPIPLSFAQQRLWFLDQLAPGSATYNIPIALRLSGALNVAALQWSIGEIVRRHEALRTTFVAVDGQPQQVIQPFAPFQLPLIDLPALHPAATSDEREAEAARLAVAELQRPFDLGRDPLLRGVLLRLDEAEHLLALTTHHIAFDGSRPIFIRELTALYNARVAGTTPALGLEGNPLPIQYADYAVWQRQWLDGDGLAAELDYWKRQLAGNLTPLQLPTDRPRPPAQTFRGAKQAITLPRPLTQALKALSQQEDVTLFMTLLAGFQSLLSRYTGQAAIAVGTPVVHRGQPEIEHLIGCFVNTLVLRTDLGQDPPFREILRRARSVALGAYSHQRVPFELLVETLQPERDGSRNPLYQVMFVLQQASGADSELHGLTMRSLEVDGATARLDLLLYMHERDDHLTGVMEYNSDLFDAATIARMLRHLETLLASAVADPARRLSQLDVLPAAERALMIHGWNATHVPYDTTVCIHELVERQAARTPEAVAALFGARQLSYAQLNAQANQIAHHLRSIGVGRGSMVAVWLHRSLEMIPALLGILKAGATYVPLEPAYPQARVQWIMHSLAVRCVLTQTAQLPAIAALQPALPTLAHVLCLDTDAPAAELHGAQSDPLDPGTLIWTRDALRALPETNPAAPVSPDDLAYIIFTSGSTGTPKGVMVRHQPVINLIEWAARLWRLGPGDRVLFVTSLCFDLSVYDIFGLLAGGGAIRIAAEEELHDPERLVQILCSEPITFWDSAPAALQQLTPFLPPPGTPGTDRLRLVFQSGDWIPVALPDQIRRAFPGAEIIALGGATEATVWSNFYPIGAVDPQWTSIPYGRPMQNAQYYILDQQLNPCPPLVPGELYIGGDCLAEGYINDPALTATKFIPLPDFGLPIGDFGLGESQPPIQHPTSNIQHRLYRTGDQARFWADGTIEFLGRIDHQVKIRGFRIELGEIESVLRGHPAVEHAVVLAREDRPGDKRLVAYVVLAEHAPPTTDHRLPTTDHRLPTTDLRGFVKERLPEYMIPSAFVRLDALPVTANGKLDRKALPAPERDDLGADDALVAPRTPAEQTLAEIWSSVLRVQQVGIHDNFFTLGGDSILGIQIIARANQAGLRLAPRHLFQHQTIAELAAVAGTAETRADEQGLVSGPVALTPIQRWFFEQRLAEPRHWNQSLLLQTPPDLDPAALRAAVGRLLLHHDALRLRFTATADGWQQQQQADPGPDPFSTIDLSAVAPDEQAAAIEAAAAGIQASLDLEAGPILRVVHFGLGAGRPGRLLLVIHHLAVDGVSWRIVLDDLQRAYRQIVAGATDQASVSLPPKTSAFQQWAARLAEHARSDALRAELPYWLGLPWERVRRLPRDTPDGGNDEAAARAVVVQLSVEETRTLLQEVPDAYRTQINEVLLAALALAFSRWSGEQTLLVNLEGHGREPLFEDLDLSRTVGWFTSLAPVLLDLGDRTTPGPALQAVKEQLRQIPRRGIGYGLLRYLGEPEIAARLAALPEAEVSFNYLGQFDQALAADALLAPARERPGPAHSPRGRRSHLLEINGLVSAGRLQLGWTYSEQIHRRATIEQLAKGFVTQLQLIIARAHAPEPDSYTPSDFPLTSLNQQQLARIAAKFSKKAAN